MRREDRSSISSCPLPDLGGQATYAQCALPTVHGQAGRSGSLINEELADASVNCTPSAFDRGVPALDPSIGAMLLNHLSRTSVVCHDLVIRGEAVVRGTHWLFFTAEAADGTGLGPSSTEAKSDALIGPGKRQTGVPHELGGG